MYKDLTVVIPTLNEEDNIGRLIKTLRKMYRGINITVVDDGSRDNTRKIVKEMMKTNKNVRLINRQNETVKGLCISALAGILDCKTDYFVVIDADFQHPLDKIKEFYGILSVGKYSLVIGRRVSEVGWDWKRKLISNLAISLGQVRLMLNGRLADDIVSGFFGGHTQSINLVISRYYNKFQMEGYKVLFDLLKVLPSHYLIGYVDYAFNVREKGSSKLGKKQIWCYLKSIVS